MPLTRNQSRAIDQHAINTLGLPGVVLMENAAINATAAAVDLLDDGRDKHPTEATVTVLCGGGNNGGDGYAMARHLLLWGIKTLRLVAVKPIAELTGDAAINANVLTQLKQTIETVDGPKCLLNGERLLEVLRASDLVIDALLGTGFALEPGVSTALREPYVGVIEAINQAADEGMAAGTGPLVLSVDLPSGMDCDSGQVAEPTVQADLTVTFVDRKRGFEKAGIERYTGRVVVADIGVPADAVDQA